jgi:hypothetical protein
LSITRTRHIHNRKTKLLIQPSIHEKHLAAIDTPRVSIDTSNHNHSRLILMVS